MINVIKRITISQTNSMLVFFVFLAFSVIDKLVRQRFFLISIILSCMICIWQDYSSNNVQLFALQNPLFVRNITHEKEKNYKYSYFENFKLKDIKQVYYS